MSGGGERSAAVLPTFLTAPPTWVMLKGTNVWVKMHTTVIFQTDHLN